MGMVTLINMKKLSIQVAVMAVVTAITIFGTNMPLHAQAVVFQIGNQGPPPPRQDYQQWQSPSRSAVWIPGHNEWQNGQYVWVGGYYTYPPHKHSHWVAPRYPHNGSGYSYQPGHWSN
jgi:hypothetical protein